MDTKAFNKILYSIIIGLVLVIVCGTILVKVNKKQETPEVLLSKGKAVSLAAPQANAQTAYFCLDSIRIVTQTEEGEESGTVLVITPYLAYSSGDTVFYEELSRKKSVLKGIFKSYFTERTKSQLLEETEVKIVKLLVEQINQTLSLGQISDIYFTDYIFLE